MAAVPARARRAEAALESGGWNDASLDSAIAALSVDFQPLNDLRASEAYRLRTAGNLLRRFYLENSARDPGTTLRAHAALAAVSAAEAVR
jgi:xanthine dehydrogenase small subunit